MYYPTYYPYPYYDENEYRQFGGPTSPPPFPPSFTQITGGMFPSFPGGPSTQGPFFPGGPSSPPPSFPGGPPAQPDFPGGFDQGPPTSPPPSFTPQLQQSQVSAFAVDPGSMRRCLFRYTFVWLRNGRSFWFYPTFIGRQSVAGYRWRGNRWVYYGTDADRIRSFQCF